MPRLVIIGANNFQLPLIQKAKELGFETHVFAWEAGAVGREYADVFYPVSIIEKEKIFSTVCDLDPAGVLSIGSDLASITVNYLTEKLGLTGNSTESTRLSTNKFLMRERLHSLGVPCPGFVKFTGGDPLKATAKLNYPVIVKPTDRSGSRGVTKVEQQIGLEAAIGRALTESFSRECVIEEFITGREFSVEMISYNGQHHFLQVTEKETSGPPYFVETGQHQPANLEPDAIERIRSVVSRSLDALEVKNGASHTEVMVTPAQEVYIVEVGARMGGDYIGSHLVEYSTGYDFLEGVIRVATGNFEVPVTEALAWSGIYYILPPPGRLVEVIDNTASVPEIVKTEIYYKPGDMIPVIKESNDRVAAIIYRSTRGRMQFDPDHLIVKSERM